MSYLKVSARVIGSTSSSNLTTTASLDKVDQTDVTTVYPKTATYTITTPISADIQVNQTANTYTDTNNNNYVTYNINIKNNGPDNATGVIITDKLPTGLTNIIYSISNDGGLTWTTSDPAYNPTTGTWTIGNFQANDPTKILKITAQITTTGTIKNTATRTDTMTQKDYNYNNNAQTTITTITGQYTPKVNMYVILRPWYYDTAAGTYQTTSDVGNTIVYSINVRNYGTDDATGIVIKYQLGNGYKFTGFSTESVDQANLDNATFDSTTNTITWYIGYMPKNGMSYLKVSARVIGSTSSSNLTTTASLDKVDQTDVTTVYPKTATYTITTPTSADIQVNQTANTYTDTNNNNYVTYNINIKNNGPDNATGVIITDKLPTGLTNIIYSISNDGGLTWTTSDPAYNPTTGTWTIGNFQANDPTKILKITAQITTTGTIKNTATRTDTMTQKDYNYNNNAQTTITTT